MWGKTVFQIFFHLLEKFLQEPAFVGKSIVRNTAFFKQMQTFSGEQKHWKYMQFIFFFNKIFQYFAIKQLPTVWTPYQSNALATDHNTTTR